MKKWIALLIGLSMVASPAACAPATVEPDPAEPVAGGGTRRRAKTRTDRGAGG